LEGIHWPFFFRGREHIFAVALRQQFKIYSFLSLLVYGPEEAPCLKGARKVAIVSSIELLKLAVYWDDSFHSNFHSGAENIMSEYESD
jgi:hypothetical protein